MNMYILQNPRLWRLIFILLIIPGAIYLWNQRIFVGQKGTRVWTPEIIIVLIFLIYFVHKAVYAHLCVPVTWLRERKAFVFAAERSVIRVDEVNTALRFFGTTAVSEQDAEFKVELKGDEAFFEDLAGNREYHLIGSFMGLTPPLLLASALGKFIHRSDKRLKRSPNTA